MVNDGWIALGVSALFTLAAFNPRRSAASLPSFGQVCEVASQLPGRLRLILPATKKDPARAQAMKTQLESTGAVRRVELNPVTGSVLIVYDPQQVDGAVVEGAVIRLMGLDQEIQKRPVSRMEEGLKMLTRAIDQSVMDATGGLLDGRMLAGSALVITALAKRKAAGLALPGAATLLWWATGLLGRSGNYE